MKNFSFNLNKYKNNGLELIQFIGLFILLFMGSCSNPGLNPDDKVYSFDGSLIQNYEIVKVPVRIGLSHSQFGLGPINFNLTLGLNGCASGHFSTFTLNSDYIDLYRYDLGCSLSISYFYINGEKFVPESGFNPAPGSLNKFISPSQSEAYFYVNTQIPSPVTTNSNGASFEFYDVISKEEIGFNIPENIVSVKEAATEVYEQDGNPIEFDIFKISEKDQSPLLVEYEVYGTAIAGLDYEPVSGFVTIPAGATSSVVSINLIDDITDELNEIIGIRIKSGLNYYQFGDSHTVIIDNDETTSLPANKSFWYNSEIFTQAQGTGISIWPDSSSNSNDAIQNSNVSTPIYTKNIHLTYPSAKFDGKKDSLSIVDHVEVNTGGPYENKFMAIAIKTSNDILRRQVIWDQGDELRGMNVYIDQGEIYFAMWNMVNDDGNNTTPWDIKYVKFPILLNEFYFFVMQQNVAIGELSVRDKNGVILKTSGVGMLYSHPGLMSMGAISGKTLFHDHSTSASKTGFKGDILETVQYNNLDNTETELLYNYFKNKYFDLKPDFSVSLDTNTIQESEGTGTLLNLELSFPLSTPTQIYISTSGSAFPGQDYEYIVNPVIIPAYQLSVSIPVIPIDDNLTELTENIVFTITDNPSFNILNNNLQLQVIDNDQYIPNQFTSLWLVSDLGASVSGGTVSSWLDQSVGNNDSFQSKKRQQPRFVGQVFGNLSGVQFDGNDDVLQIASSATLDGGGPYLGRTVAVGFKTGSDVTSRQFLFRIGNSDKGMVSYIESGFLYFNVFNLTDDSGGISTPWGPVHVKSPIVANQFNFAIFLFDAVTNILTIRINKNFQQQVAGVGPLYATSASTDIGGLTSATRLHNGTLLTSGSSFNGSLGGVIVTNELLSFNKVLDLESYLNSRYKDGL